MASLTIRNIDDQLKTRLWMRAAERGRSMEEEMRQILRDALDREPPDNLEDLALSLFGAKHGVDLEPHPAMKAPWPPDLHGLICS